MKEEQLANELAKAQREHCENLLNNNACFKPFDMMNCKYCLLCQLCKCLSDAKENCIDKKKNLKEK